MGYLNRVIQLDFPDLAGTEPDTGRSIIWLTIKNPRLMSGNDLIAAGTTVRRDADGNITMNNRTAEEAFGGFAKLVIAGNVLDPTVDSDDPPTLRMPPEPADVAKYPIEVLNRIGEELTKANPR
jgi:hypothetical protein